MEPIDLLRFATEVFERLGIDYLVTGSMATIAYGEPRFTNDIDIVVNLPPELARPLHDAFPESDYYVSLPAIEDAISRRHQFNIIHPKSGLKIDVIIASESEFDASRLSRGRWLPLLSDRSVCFASPEDVILKKLAYFREGGSPKHIRDIIGVLSLRGNEIDRRYIETWVARLDLTVQWQHVLDSMK